MMGPRAIPGSRAPAGPDRTLPARAAKGRCSPGSQREGTALYGHTGSSMNPTILDGDLIEVVPYGDQSIHRGDVILFRSPADGQAIAHRVVALTSSGIRARGDNSPGIDPWVLQPDDILGPPPV